MSALSQVDPGRRTVARAASPELSGSCPCKPTTETALLRLEANLLQAREGEGEIEDLRARGVVVVRDA